MVASCLADSHWAHTSTCAVPSASGVLTLIRRPSFSSAVVEAETLVAGRVLASRISSPTCRIEVINLHNFGLSARDAALVDTRVRATSTVTGMQTIIFGDWNLAPPNAPTLVHDGPSVSAAAAGDPARGM